jgi:hypothetical protein
MLRQVPSAPELLLEGEDEQGRGQSLLQHELASHTFLRPTDCALCGKLLLGVFKQGLRCRCCGLAVHDGCAARANELLVCSCAAPARLTFKQQGAAGGPRRRPLLDVQSSSAPPRRLELAVGDAKAKAKSEAETGGASRSPSSASSPSSPPRQVQEWAVKVQRDAKAAVAQLRPKVSSVVARIEEASCRLDRAIDQAVGEINTATQLQLEGLARELESEWETKREELWPSSKAASHLPPPEEDVEEPPLDDVFWGPNQVQAQPVPLVQPAQPVQV